MRKTIRVISGALLCFVTVVAEAHAGGFAVTGQSAGPTPFLAAIDGNYGGTLKTASFSLLPQPGSYTRPIKATYSAIYLKNNGYLQASTIQIPVFGLYDNATNTVSLTLIFTDGTTVVAQVGVSTPKYTDPCATINNVVNYQYRTATSDLPFDYMLLKDDCSINSPAILDTDGRIRWVGTAGVATLSSILNANAIFASDGKTGINRIALESGKYTKLVDFKDTYNVTSTAPHNIDYGRNGSMIVEVNTTGQLEANAIEFDVNGKVLNQWDMVQIVDQAITNAGADPTNFVYPTVDWFHMNSTAYSAKDNTLIVSSRENGIFDVDYDAPANGAVRQLHWIIGDNTKYWYTGNFLTSYAITLGSASNNSGAAPIGQHAVSIDSFGNLLYMNDGLDSQLPEYQQRGPGINRNLSFAGSLQLNTSTKMATPEYNQGPQPTIYSPICGSVYDFKSAHLVDFATDGMNFDPKAPNYGTAEIMGFGPSTGNSGKYVFFLGFSNPGDCGAAWNAVPLDLSNVVFN